MLIPAMTNPLELAWLGVILLLCGETAALLATRNLARLIALSTVAEFGYVLFGFGIGGPVGTSGAMMHLGYQIVMRGLLIVTAWWLVRRTESAELDDLAGSGRRMPVVTTLFGFAMFSVMGLSPFKGSFSKFLVLYAAIEQGQWLLAAAGTLATIIASFYYMIVIQRVCFEAPRRQISLQAVPAWVTPLAGTLTALTVVMSLWPAPFLALAENLAWAGETHAVPHFDSPWSWLGIVPYVGGFVLYGLGRISVRARDVEAVVLSVATVVLAWLAPDLDPASRLFALVVAGISLTVTIYSLGYMVRSEHANSYWFFLFLMSGSLLGVMTAHDFGNFYVFWELMTWTSYFLVIHERDDKALTAGLVYFVMCAAGA
jgi:formate hydrogenlyase subunit 3/multisubunit Na+/H+ antiporter MnhD subunit